MLILPGVTGCSTDEYIKDMSSQAIAMGYTPVVLNCFAARDETDNRLLDFSDPQTVGRAVDLIHEVLGTEVEIYGVGFSLGANHLLRYIGDSQKNSGLKAAISISNPFDLLAAGVKIKSKLFGFYDSAMGTYMKKPFLEKRFKLDT